jgi:hypothetical protein
MREVKCEQAQPEEAPFLEPISAIHYPSKQVRLRILAVVLIVRNILFSHN